MNSYEEDDDDGDDDAFTGISVSTSTRAREVSRRARASVASRMGVKPNYSEQCREGEKFEISQPLFTFYAWCQLLADGVVVKRKRSDAMGAPSGMR